MKHLSFDFYLSFQQFSMLIVPTTYLKMFLNELPDDCLRAIFAYLNNLDDLLGCYVACKRWRTLILERTKKVRYLLGQQPGYLQNYNPVFVYYSGCLRSDGVFLRKLFPNLRVIEIANLFKKTKFADVAHLIGCSRELRGLINTPRRYYGPMAKFCKSLEMISTSRLETSMKEHGAKVKQLDLLSYSCESSYTLDDFKDSIHHFPNLERLRVYHNEVGKFYRGLKLKNLKILEMSLNSFDGREVYFAFQFMDACPALQSAHILMDCNQIYPDVSIKNENLQDLVLDFSYENYHQLGSWNDVFRLLTKYPNIKHLAIRNNKFVRNSHMDQLLQTLPKLVLLDLRGSPRITRNGVGNVKYYCARNNRSIKVYFKLTDKQIQEDWPELSNFRCKVSQGFDFMKNCFLKDFYYLSYFMDPML